MKSKTGKRILTVLVALIIAAAAFAAGFFTRKLTQGGNLSSLEWFLNTVEDNYYFGVADDGFTQYGLKEIAEKYLDRYSEYYTAEEYARTLESNGGMKSGLGITYSYVNGKGLFINAVTGNSPAYMCGLRAGETLESGCINGGERVVFNSSESFSAFVNSASDADELSLYGADGNVYSVKKAGYTASYTAMYTNSSSWQFNVSDGGLALYETGEKAACLPDGAALISISQFYGTAAPEFYRLVEKFNAMNMTSLIIDLRSNGGGYVQVMQSIAGSFAGGEQKPAMYSRDKRGREVRFDCDAVRNAEYRVSGNVDVYVLANSGTASASEALIGALVCYGVLEYKNIFISEYTEGYLNWLEESGQEVKNGRTYGKGIMQTTFENRRTGEALKLTTAKIFWPDRTTCIHDTGIGEGCTLIPADWARTKGDEELARAAEIIKTRN